MIKQGQILGLEDIFEDIENQTGANSVYLPLEGGEIDGNLNITGTLSISGNFYASGDGLFISDNGIEIMPHNNENKTGLYLYISNRGEENACFAINSENGIGSIELGSETNISIDNISGGGQVSIGITGEKTVKIDQTGIYLSKNLKTDGTIYEEFYTTTSSGDSEKIVDLFFTGTAISKEYRMGLYLDDKAQMIYAEITDNNGEPYIKYSAGDSEISGVVFTCSRGGGTVYLKVTNSGINDPDGDIEIRGISRERRR